MKIIPDETYGIIECLGSSLIFFMPNFLLFFSIAREIYWVFMLYNYIMMFILISVMAHFRFSRHYLDSKKPK